MIHARKDYNRFQDPALQDPSLLSDGSTPIAKDEPVMLFRAKDRLMPIVLEAYVAALRMCATSKTQAMAEVVEEFIETVKDWQDKNGCKIPDLPG